MNSLDLFGKKLIESTRIKTIDSWERIIGGKLKGERAEKVRAIMAEKALSGSGFSELLPIVVDSVIHNMLQMMEDEERLTITWDSTNVVEESDGLSGELYGTRGWIARFGVRHSSSEQVKGEREEKEGKSA